jgi:hypothetical protein
LIEENCKRKEKSLIEIAGTTTLTVLIPITILTGSILFDRYFSDRYKGIENMNPSI